MLEVVIAASLIAVAFAAFGRRQETSPLISLDTTETDLPCPWCMGPTADTDKTCNTCGQDFG
ncbi:MAG: hypothetical protein OEM94_05120 [Acidimicrobiia bacterium]|nr:hypothetical protein [Acidimicrobiia bacterium]MDH3470679.1 hypothetical protein [Acidimicrobiia bacterium]